MRMNSPKLVLIAGTLSLALTGTAIAQNCPCGGGNRLTGNQINALLPGKTVCAVIGNNKNTMWQEYHNGSQVVELGNSTAGDVVGSWSTSGGNGVGNSFVTYNYGSGGSYTYSMCQEGALYHFCGATNVTNATIIAGSAKCYP